MNVLSSSRVIQMIGLSRVTIWRLEGAGEFPERLQLGHGRVGWLESEIIEWIESRPRGIAKAETTQP